MTVLTDLSRVSHDGNGVATTFDFPFRIFDEGDLVVTVIDTHGTVTDLSLGSDYAVIGAGDSSGGSVSYPLTGAPLAAGKRIVLRRLMDVTQTAEIENQGGFYPDVHESAFDKGTMIDQQLQEQIDRALRLAPSDAARDMMLPLIDNLRSKLLGFSSIGQPVGVSGVDRSSDTVTGIGATTPMMLADFIRQFDCILLYGPTADGVTIDNDALDRCFAQRPRCWVPAGVAIALENYVIPAGKTLSIDGIVYRSTDHTVPLSFDRWYGWAALIIENDDVTIDGGGSIERNVDTTDYEASVSWQGGVILRRGRNFSLTGSITFKNDWAAVFGELGPAFKDRSFDSGVSVWDDASTGTATISWDSGNGRRMDLNGVDAGNIARADQMVAGFVVGGLYRIRFFSTGADVSIRLGATAGADDIKAQTDPAGLVTVDFKPTTEDVWVRVSSEGAATVDSFSVARRVQDGAIANGMFSSGIAGWTDNSSGTGASSWNSTNKRLRLTGTPGNAAAVYQALTLTPGAEYRIEVRSTPVSGSSALVRVKAGLTAGASDQMDLPAATGGYVRNFIAGATCILQIEATATADVDFVRIRRVLDGVEWMSHNTRLSGMSFKDCQHLVYLADTHTLSITNSNLCGCIGGDGVRLWKNNLDTTITGNLISNNGSDAGSGSMDGLDIYYAGNRLIISGNIIVGNRSQGIDIKRGEASHAEDYGNSEIIISDNILIDNFFSGISFDHSQFSPTYQEKIIISDNLMAGHRLDGITADYLKDATISGNIIYRNLGSGINLDGGHSSYVQIKDNQCHGNGVRGINVEDVGQEQITIDGNSCRGNGLGGIRASNVTGLIVEDNVCNDNGDGATTSIGILVGNSVSVSIDENQCRNTDAANKLQAYGILMSANTRVTIGAKNICRDHQEIAGIVRDFSTDDTNRHVTCPFVQVHLPTAAGTSTITDHPLMEAPSNCVVFDVRLWQGGPVAPHASNYMNMILNRKRREGGVTSSDIIFTASTRSDIGSPVTIEEYRAVSLKLFLSTVGARVLRGPDTSGSALYEGDVLTFSKTVSGTGADLSGAVLAIAYVPH